MRAERWIGRVHSRLYTSFSIALLVFGAAAVALWAAGLILSQPLEVTVQRLQPEEGREPAGGPFVAFPTFGSVELVIGVPTFGPVQLAIGAAALTGALGMLAFKGYVRRVWSRNYFDYDVFRLVVRMRGASTRQRILRQLIQPMNRNQLAKELGIDWKSVDRHIELLLRHGLIEDVEGSGERAYRLSERGKRLLELLEEMAEIERGDSGGGS